MLPGTGGSRLTVQAEMFMYMNVGHSSEILPFSFLPMSTTRPKLGL
jgi:hypothetical protein